MKMTDRQVNIETSSFLAWLCTFYIIILFFEQIEEFIGLALLKLYEFLFQNNIS